MLKISSSISNATTMGSPTRKSFEVALRASIVRRTLSSDAAFVCVILLFGGVHRTQAWVLHTSHAI